MNTRRATAWFAPLLALAAGFLCSCADRPIASKPSPTPPAVTAQPPALPSPPDDPGAPIHERIARALIRGAPPADPADPRARDAASAAFSRLDLLLNTADARILWGIHDPATPLDPLDIKSIQLDPLAFAKLYLSLFMFSGEHSIRRDGDYTILDLAVRFRAALPTGDYPHPLWHSPDEWSAYAQAKSLRLVFLNDHFFAAYLPTPTDPAPSKSPLWDDRWHWTDAAGAPQPRVAEFSYFLSPDNPHIAPATDSFTRLRGALRAQGCLACHSPDNKHNASVLLLLGFPAQAVAARHAIPAVLKENSMPPGDPRHGQPRGLRNDADRRAMILLAEDFEKHAEDAMLFESDARGVPRRPAPPPRPKPEY